MTSLFSIIPRNFARHIVHLMSTFIYPVNTCNFTRLFCFNEMKFYLGDILLGGFFPIHQPPTYELGSMQCTAMKRERGIQRLEAMLFALDVVNRRSSGLMRTKLRKTNIRFGALIYDSCDYESYAVERAFNMLLPSVDQCTSPRSQQDSPVIAGVIGSASSIVSMAIADILRLAEVKLIDSLTSLLRSIKYMRIKHVRIFPFFIIIIVVVVFLCLP